MKVLNHQRGGSWRWIRFYGSPYSNDQECTWNLLRNLGRSQSLSWMVCKDFNEILFSNEKCGGELRDEHKMNEFRHVMKGYHFKDMGFNDRWFTWERGNRSKNNICERLDRGLATVEWSQIFPNFSVNHLSHSFLDHFPLFINKNDEILRGR